LLLVERCCLVPGHPVSRSVLVRLRATDRFMMISGRPRSRYVRWRS
jgi:hypothetical protein